jgi:hypothetical protein|tara:strand:+ start:557 stop:865 length:309 start_codon:yes stop_codon:yes gene_type:complete
MTFAMGGFGPLPGQPYIHLRSGLPGTEVNAEQALEIGVAGLGLGNDLGIGKLGRPHVLRLEPTGARKNLEEQDAEQTGYFIDHVKKNYFVCQPLPSLKTTDV